MIITINLVNKNQKGSVHLFLLVIIVLIGISGLFYYSWQKGLLRTTKYDNPPQSKSETENWKVFKNESLGFEIKYPSDYFLSDISSSENPQVKISNLSSFEEDEFALLVTLEPLSQVNFTPSSNSKIIDILNNVGFNDLQEKWGNNLSGSFLGDPPWSYYYVAFPSMDATNKSILVTVKIHRTDQLDVSERGTEKELITTAKLILSTFQFISKKVSGEYIDENVSFNYPSDWEQTSYDVLGSRSIVEIQDKQNFYTLTFTTQANYNNGTGKPYESLQEFAGIDYLKPFDVDGQEAIQPLPRAGSENISAVYFFSKDKKSIYILELEANITDEDNVQQSWKQFDQILSTFRFLN